MRTYDRGGGASAFPFPFTDVHHLYQKQKTSEQPLVACRGGMIERQWLTLWGIPHIDLEPLGYPKFDHLPRLGSVGSCGRHRDPLCHHCPKGECYHFVQWMQGQRGLDHDMCYVNHEQRIENILREIGVRPSPDRELACAAAQY